MKIVAVQTSPRFLKPDENRTAVARTLDGVRNAVVILPELFTSGYNFSSLADVRRAAEPARTGPTAKWLRGLSRANDLLVIAGFPERHGRDVYNSAIIQSARNVSVYRKIHLFGEESRYFKPGRTQPPVVSWKGARIGTMICFDWFFPEAARLLALRGADIIAHPSNLVLPWAPEGMRVRALENGVFAVTANRVGIERRLRFIGRTQIVDPKGGVLARLGGRPGVIVREIEPREARDKRVAGRSDRFKDRQPALYRPLVG